MPSHALAMAGSLSGSGLADRALSAVGLSDTKSDEAVRVSTISQITRARERRSSAHVGSREPANAAAFSADGTKFAIGYGDGRIMVGRTDRTGKDTSLEGHTGRVWSVSFCPDGRQLASASTHEVLLWDLERGEAQPLCGGGVNFTDVVFDPQRQLSRMVVARRAGHGAGHDDLAIPIVQGPEGGLGGRL